MAVAKTRLLPLLILTALAAACLLARPAAAPTAQPTPAHGSQAASPLPAWAGGSWANPAGAARSPGAAAPPLIATPQEQDVATFSGQRAWEHVWRLAAEIGARNAGSAEDRQAAEYIASEFQSYGYEVSWQSFPVSYFEPLSARLDILTPEERAIAEAQPLTYSGSGDATGPLIYAALGRWADLAGLPAAGAILLVQRGEITFRAKADNAQAVGAAALVIFNNRPGPFQGSLGAPTSIPALAVSQEEGEYLRTLLEQGPVEARVAAETIAEERESYNIVATTGDEPPRVVVGGHYDSVPGSPGANDNASGTGIVLELARVLAATGENRGIAFVAFSGEELGLVGSRHFVAALGPRRLSALRAMFSIDMVAVGDRLLVARGNEQSRELQDRALAAVRGAGLSADGVAGRGGSDHAPFAQAGVPALLFWRPDDPHYHTPRDTPDRVAPERLEALGQAVLALLRQLRP